MAGRYDRGFGSYSGGGGRYGGFRSGGGGSFDSELRKPDFSDLKPFRRDFYRPHPSVEARTQVEMDAYCHANRISVEGSHLRPMFSFVEASFPAYIQRTVERLGFSKPTPIQSASLPILLSGSDLVGIAQTGSGKTLAYMLPAIVQAANQDYSRPGDGPIILVIAPTRELAQQIQTVASEFGSASQCRNCCIYGGAPKRAQLDEYRRGAEILIGTPGRMIDFLHSGDITLKRVTYLVLDEADRMLDMGFEPQIRKLIGQIRPDRQTCMFSATWPQEVRKLANEFLSKACYVTIGDRDLSANHNITQIVEICSEYDKDHKVKSVLYEIMKERSCKTIVFAQTKRRVRDFHDILSRMGFPVLDIHGDKKQYERDRTLRQFRESKKAILIATDVASRGLDVEDVKFVVNIDYPSQTEDYIHRIGRTARSNHHGTSYTFFTDKNRREAPKLVKVLQEAGQPVPDKLLEMAGGGGHRRYGGGMRGGGDRYGGGGGNGRGMRRMDRGAFDDGRNTNYSSYDTYANAAATAYQQLGAPSSSTNNYQYSGDGWPEPHGR